MSENLVIENIRMKELVIVVNQNQGFFDEFLLFLKKRGYASVHKFIIEPSADVAASILKDYFATPFDSTMLDGIGRPYEDKKAKWYFMAWLFRDAPAQRLGPLLQAIKGSGTIDKQIKLLNRLREFVGPLFPNSESWKWPALSEVMLARLEGSRRSLRGGLFENIIRRLLTDLMQVNGLSIKITDKEIRLLDESYDIEVTGKNGRILIPVKTRETMGGGHALLFTRDIHKSITIAQQNGYKCIPIVIAESWVGDLASLGCENFIHIGINPNQLDRVEVLIQNELVKLIGVFKKIS